VSVLGAVIRSLSPEPYLLKTGEVGSDGVLADQARRLTLSAELTRRATRCAGGAIPPEADGAALLALARRLADVAAPVERAHRLQLRPAYPGVSAGVQQVAGGWRLVLACRALFGDGAPSAVVFTALISGRAPRVSLAPGLAPIPPGWHVLPLCAGGTTGVEHPREEPH
jgi:hypothetical protein